MQPVQLTKQEAIDEILNAIAHRQVGTPMHAQAIFDAAAARGVQLLPSAVPALLIEMEDTWLINGHLSADRENPAELRFVYRLTERGVAHLHDRKEFLRAQPGTRAREIGNWGSRLAIAQGFFDEADAHAATDAIHSTARRALAGEYVERAGESLGRAQS